MDYDFILGAAFVAFLVFFIIFFAQLDCDFTLYIYSKLGRGKKAMKDKVVWITWSSS